MSRYANRTSQPKPAVVSRKSSESSSGKGAVSGSTPSNAMRGQVNSMAIQAKLKVGSAYDPAEAEADNAAREVVHGNQGSVAAGTSGTGIQAKPLVSRISRQVQRTESAEDLDMQRSEEDMQMQRSEEEAQMQRSEEDMQMQRFEEEAQMQRSEEDMQMQRSEEEVQAKCASCGGEMQLQREEEDAQLQREEELQAKCADCEAKKAQREEDDLQAKSAPDPVNHKQGFTTTQETTDKVMSRKGKGDAMPDAFMTEMESGFGADFSGINIHTDSVSAELNREVKAKAFTTGSDVFFGEGQFDPGSDKGKELIAHELTHTIQQGEAPAKESTAEKPSSETASGATSAETSADALETAASEAAKTATAELPQTEAPAAEGEATPAVEAEGLEPEALDDSEVASAEKEAADAADKAVGSEEAAPQGGGAGGGALPTGGEYDLDDNSGRTNISDKVAERAATAGDRAKNGGETAQHLEAESAEVCPNAMESTQELAEAESAHEPVEDKVTQVVEAEEIGEDFGQAEGQTAQVSGLEGDAENADEVKGDEASKALEGSLDDNTPTTMEDLDEYDASEAATAVTEEMAPQVTAVKNTFGRIEKEDPEKVAQRKATELPGPEAAEEVNKMKLGEGAVPGVPEAMTDMSEYDEDFNGALEKEGITQEQLDMVDKGPLAEARGERDGIREKVDSAPGELQGFAEKQATNVDGEMDKEEEGTRKEMRKERDGKLKEVEGEQKKAKEGFEKERSWVSIEVDKRYKAVEDKIKNRLTKLETENEKKFFKKVAQFSREFEKQVKDDVNEYLAHRQSGALGWIVAGYDWLTGIDDHPQVVRAFEKAREDYIKKIDDEIKAIADETNKVIEECKTWLKDGKKEIEDWLADLPADQQEHAETAAKEMNKKFEDLDKFIDKKKEELVAKLCQMKEKAIEHIDAKIEKMKEEMAGAIAKALLFLIDAALSFFTWALETVGYDMAKIKPQISKTRATLKEIVMHPMAFMGNLIDATGQGFNQFGDNIKKHMISGLVNWMTGTMGDIDIQLPETWNMKGFGMFFLEMLGISWNVLRQKLGRFIPEEVISFAENSVGMVKALITDGPMGMWKEIQKEMGAIKEQVMESVREMLIFELVKKGITHLLSMLIPGAGFVKAIIAIYDIIMFFVENWDNIVQLVMTIFKSVGDIAMGRLGKAAGFIENAMAMTLPIMFNFLARLLHLGAFGKKIQKAIKKIRAPIDKIIDKALKKIAKIARKMFGGGKKKKGKKGKKDKDKDKDKKDGLTDKDRKKHLKIAKKVKKGLEDVPKKDYKDFKAFHADRKKKAKQLEGKYQSKVKKKVKGKTVKLWVEFDSVAKDKKDGDVDFEVIIAPNATNVPGNALNGNAYPGSGILPSSRTIHELWKDVDPGNKLPNEGNGNAAARVSMAKEELAEKYKVHGSKARAKEIIGGIVKHNHGQSPRRFATALKEYQMNNSAHIHDRHIKGMGILPTEEDQALRVIRKKPFTPANAGFFLSHAAANNSILSSIKQEFGSGKNAKWISGRDKVVEKYIKHKGTNQNKVVVLGPLGGKAFNLKPKGTYNLPADFPKYFQSVEINHVGDNLKNPNAVGERPLWRRDRRASAYNLADISNPMTEKFTATQTYVRVVPDMGIKGGWYVNSAWPQ